MFRKNNILDLSGKKIKIFEPTISELFEIESLQLENSKEKEDNEIKRRLLEVFEILNIPKEHILLSKTIIDKVLSGFKEKNKTKGGNDYFLGILGLLAHHNFMDLKSFCKKYCLSDLKDCLNSREYYFNIVNDKASENSKFHDKTEISKEKVEEIESFITKMTNK